jgi:hypothetical protein
VPRPADWALSEQGRWKNGILDRIDFSTTFLLLLYMPALFQRRLAGTVVFIKKTVAK